jgi:hypothetical protein
LHPSSEITAFKMCVSKRNVRRYVSVEQKREKCDEKRCRQDGI